MRQLYFILLLIIFSYSAEAQISIAIAKDTHHSVLDYKVEWGYGYSSENTVQASEYLKLKGYTQKDIYDQTCLKECGHDITAGYYVVVKSSFKEYKDLTRKAIGLGASEKSYEEATTRAVENLSIYNWNWLKSDGYEVVEKGFYNNLPVKQFIYMIYKKNTDCGMQADSITCLMGMYDNTTIGNLEISVQKSIKEKNLLLPEVGHFRVKTKFIGVIKESKFCEISKKYYYSYYIVQADSITEITAIVKPSEYQSQATTKSIYKIINTNLGSQPGYFPNGFLNSLRKIIGIESKDLKKIRTTAIGIRG